MLPTLVDVQAERCRRDLGYFIREAWQLVEPGTRYVGNWHIDAISAHLEAVTRRDIRRLLITIPPRCMKSLAVSVFWPCWSWLERPETRWLFASYAASLSIRDSLKCRRLIQSVGAGVDDTDRSLIERVGYQGLLRALDGDNAWQLTGDQNQKTRFENTRTGYRLATSVGGTATGEGGDVLVIDDAAKADEAQSDVIRQGVLDWHDATMSTRLNDPKTGAEVVIMQRLHEQDLAGHLLEQDASAGEWTHLCLPARFEPAHPFVWPDDPRTVPGELLWPERIDELTVARLERQMGSYIAAGQLQQRPAPLEGGILKRAWWQWYPPFAPWPHFDEVVQSWDMAFKDTDGSDFVVGQVWGRFGSRKYLLHQVRDRLDLPATIDAVEDVTAWVEQRLPGHAAHRKLVEDKANGPAVISSLKHRVPGLIAVDPEGDKVARAHAVAADVEAGDVYLPGYPGEQGYDRTMTDPWVQALVEEASGFPNMTHDDQVDALTQALRRLAGARGGVRPAGGRSVLSGIRSRGM